MTTETGDAMAGLEGVFPQTQMEFEQRFSTEEACLEHLRARRWRAGFCCPKCGGTKAWQLRTRRLDECASCRHQVSLTAGTVFHGTRKPLRLWFRVIAQFLVSKSGCSATDIARQHGLDLETAWTWLHKLRSLMVRREGRKLQGPVEVDEAFIGGVEPWGGRRHLGEKKAMVVTAAESRGLRCGRIRLEAITGAKGKVLSEFVGRTVSAASVVRTDGLMAYKPLKRQGFRHERRVVGKKNASKYLPHVHRIFSLVKRLLLGTYQGGVTHKHLPRYLDEFVFRFNRRSATNRWLLFQRLTDSCFRRVPTHDELVADLTSTPPT